MGFVDVCSPLEKAVHDVSMPRTARCVDRSASELDWGEWGSRYDHEHGPAKNYFFYVSFVDVAAAWCTEHTCVALLTEAPRLRSVCTALRWPYSAANVIGLQQPCCGLCPWIGFWTGSQSSIGIGIDFNTAVEPHTIGEIAPSFPQQNHQISVQNKMHGCKHTSSKRFSRSWGSWRRMPVMVAASPASTAFQSWKRIFLHFYFIIRRSFFCKQKLWWHAGIRTAHRAQANTCVTWE